MELVSKTLKKVAWEISYDSLMSAKVGSVSSVMRDLAKGPTIDKDKQFSFYIKPAAKLQLGKQTWGRVSYRAASGKVFIWASYGVI